MLCLAGDAEVLLLLWRDPVSGAEVWEPPGGGLEDGESYADAAARELFEEAGLLASGLSAPVMVERDYVWAGNHIVCTDAVFLASWPSRPDCDARGLARPDRPRVGADPAARLARACGAGLAAGRPQLPALGTTQPAIAMNWTNAAAITRAWKTSWKPKVRGHRFGRLAA